MILYQYENEGFYCYIILVLWLALVQKSEVEQVEHTFVIC